MPCPVKCMHGAGIVLFVREQVIDEREIGRSYIAQLSILYNRRIVYLTCKTSIWLVQLTHAVP